MKAEEQILELLTEVLRKQDRMQATQDQVQGQLGSLENKVDGLENRMELFEEELKLTNERVNVVVQVQQASQKILRALATEQQRQGKEITSIRETLTLVEQTQQEQSRRLDRLEHPGDFV